MLEVAAPGLVEPLVRHHRKYRLKDPHLAKRPATMARLG